MLLGKLADVYLDGQTQVDKNIAAQHMLSVNGFTIQCNLFIELNVGIVTSGLFGGQNLKEHK